MDENNNGILGKLTRTKRQIRKEPKAAPHKEWLNLFEAIDLYPKVFKASTPAGSPSEGDFRIAESIDKITQLQEQGIITVPLEYQLPKGHRVLEAWAILKHSDAKMAEKGLKFTQGPKQRRQDNLTRAIVKAFESWVREMKTSPTARNVWDRIEEKGSILEKDQDDFIHWKISRKEETKTSFHAFEKRLTRLRQNGTLPKKTSKNTPGNPSQTSK